MVDVLNLKLSSRVVANIPLSDRFWHSRFWHGREFEYIFEFVHHTKYNGRWKDVFSTTRRQQHHPSLINRKRIWGLATRLHSLLAQIGTCHGSAIRSWFEPDVPPDSGAWITASRHLKPVSSAFYNGSRSLYDRVLAFPEILSSISVSVVDSFTGSYISGIQIKDTNGSHRDLGYF